MARTALISVSNKSGLIAFVKTLNEVHGFNIISSGGTAKSLQENGIPVQKVSEYTGSPEILEGRVKTLHPKIHGGILAKRNDPIHTKDMQREQIKEIDLVVVNLYPFIETIKDPSVSREKAIENIDIGGPTMIRAAAKNHANVTVLTRPDQYESYLNALKEGKGSISKELSSKFALEAFEHTAEYDIAISKWFNKKLNSDSEYSNIWIESMPIKQKLRYGENPHQKANWYSCPKTGWGGALQIQGKELSTNNLLDLEAAFRTIKEFGYDDERLSNLSKKKATSVVIKHLNPCGVAESDITSESLRLALDADRISAFGGIVAINKNIDIDTANELTNHFLECIVAPSFDKDALNILSNKKNLRVIKLTSKEIINSSNSNIRSILGGVLIQDQDDNILNTNDWEVVTNKEPKEDVRQDLIFSWKVSKHVKSNAIVVASSGQTLGIGAGQMNRVGSAKIALEAAADRAKGAVLASDGFFPFDDSVRLASKHGITAIIQPGGSIRDKDSINTCNELGISMILTQKRHFLH